MRPETLDGCRRLAWYRRLLREEEGIALIFAIVSLVVLTAVLTAVIFLTAAGARDAQRSNAGQRAYSLAESGLNDALAILNANYPGTLGYPGDDKLLSTTLTSPVTLPAAGTISVANTTDFNPAPGTNTIALRSAGAISGPITCTGISATSFTGCTGGAAGPYPVGATVGRAACTTPSTTTPAAPRFSTQLAPGTRPPSTRSSSSFANTTAGASASSRALKRAAPKASITLHEERSTLTFGASEAARMAAPSMGARRSA